MEKTRLCVNDFFHYVEVFSRCSHFVPTRNHRVTSAVTGFLVFVPTVPTVLAGMVVKAIQTTMQRP